MARRRVVVLCGIGVRCLECLLSAPGAASPVDPALRRSPCPAVFWPLVAPSVAVFARDGLAPSSLRSPLSAAPASRPVGPLPGPRVFGPFPPPPLGRPSRPFLVSRPARPPPRRSWGVPSSPPRVPPPPTGWAPLPPPSRPWPGSPVSSFRAPAWLLPSQPSLPAHRLAVLQRLFLFLVCTGTLLWNAFGLRFRPPLALAVALCCCCLRLAAVLPGCAFCATPCPVPCRVSVCVPSPRGLGGCSVPPGAMGPLAQGVPGDLGAPPRRPRPPVSPVGLAPRRLPHPAAARCVPSQSPRPSPSPGLRAGGAGWVCCRWAVSVPGGFALQRVGSSALPVA